MSLHQITEDYVSFEIAKLLKEKGFNVPCCRRYNGDSMITQSALYSTPFYQEEKSSGYVLCPTLQMAMKWLREKYHIHIDITIEGNGSYIDYKYVIRDFSIIFPTRNYDSIDDKDGGRAKTYEEAVEVAIKYCLENLI